MAVKHAQKSTKKPPAAAKDMRAEMMIALTVAAKKNSIKTSNPVKATSVIVPTCHEIISEFRSNGSNQQG